MDAYSSYIMKLSDARVGELRREAAEHAMSRAARRWRASRWAQARERLLRRGTPALEPVAPVPLANLARGPEAETPLRRTA